MRISNGTTFLAISVLLLATLCTAAAGKIIYVDDDATGANSGSSWADAYNYLQDALMAPSAGDEIRVARGIYKPHEFVLSKRPNLGRMETFQLKNGVAIRGGYAGFGESDPNARDIELYETILSGDLNGNDVEVTDPCDLLHEPTRAENSFHVVTGSGTDETTVLDGFIIAGGNAGANAPSSRGGGMYNDAGRPTVANCTFTGNSADLDGGGMYNENDSNPNLTGCTFSKNRANSGGGMHNYQSRPTLTNCIFSGNNAYYGGGGIENFYKGSPILTNCTFSENSAEWGGGIHNLWDCDPALTNCTFSRNLADDDGGGILNEENSNPSINNCTFSENVARSNSGGGMKNLNLSDPMVLNCTFISNASNIGGGVANTYKCNPILTNCTFSENWANGGGGMGNLWDSSPTLNNCTFSGNVAVYEGGGVDNSWGSNAVLTNCTFVGNSAVDVGGVYTSWDASSTLTSCILWGNTSPQLAGEAAVSYSNIQGGFPGEGNIDVDPLFADPGCWDPNGTPDDANDDFWIDGDYRLKSEAGRWESMTQAWVKDDVTSPCIDAGDPMSPIGHEPFPNGGIVNMGAYGGTAEASKSYFGEPVCETIVAGDINGDCKVNLSDLATMALHWLEDNNP